MKAIVMSSGGAGSFVELCHAVDEYGRENVLSLFADTKMEDGDLYRFQNECLEYTGVESVVLEDGRNPWEVFRDVKFIGNSRIDPCSRILKRDLLNKWVRDNYGPDECVVHYGIDYSEKHRLERVAKRTAPYKARSIMIERQQILGPREKIEFCKSKGIEPPRLYAMGFSHNNCGGFCVKAGLAQFKQLLERMPERYEWHVKQEEQARKAVPNAKPFLRMIQGGETKYFWLSEYRDWLKENQLTGEDLFDYGGCGCALE